MKDIPHHMADFIKNYSKTPNPEGDKVLDEFEKEHPKSQEKKQKKSQMRKEKEHKVPEHFSPEESNRKMKKRTPKIRERSHRTSF